MSGEGAGLVGSHSAGFADIVARMKAGQPLFDRVGHQPAEWDQRPGDLEATRTLEAAPIVVVGMRLDEETARDWRVQLLRGGIVLAVLDAEAAAGLAHDLADMVDVITGRRW